MGFGGLVNAANISTGFVRDALLDPGLVLKENTQEDVRPNDPMIWASDADWQELAAVLVNRNICELLEFDDIAEVNGRKVLGGLMGVAKAGNDRNTGPQRLIMNIKVSNWAQNIIAGNMPQLPPVVNGGGRRRNSDMVRRRSQVLFLRVRNSKAMATVDGICKTCES